MKIIRRALAVLLTVATLLPLSVGAFAADWTDVPKGSWYETYVNSVVDAGLMNGTGDGVFAPNSTLSRAMFVTILNRAAGAPEVASNTVYSDVADGAWYDLPVEWAESQGIVNGYTNGNFGVNDPLTREQMVTILYRYVSANQTVAAPATALDAFTDKNTVSSYAVDAFRWAVSEGIISGKGQGTLDPKGTSTRAEAAAVITRFLSYADAKYKKLTRSDLEAAITELGIQFHLKGAKFQYDSIDMSSVFSRYFGGHYRLTESAVPEYGTDDTTIYSVCSDYVYKSYFSAFGYRIFGSKTYNDSVTDAYWKFCEPQGMLLFRWAKDESIITDDDLKFGVTKESLRTMDELHEFIRNWKTTLRPGDVLLPKGHALLYIGNGYVMDCGGGKYDMSTGIDQVEATGAVRYLHKIEELFLTDKSAYGVSYYMNPEKPGPDYFCILRPLNALVTDDGDNDPGNDPIKSSIYSLPDATKTRMKYRGMEINRTVDISPYGSTFTGDTLTYNVAVSNMSNQKNYVTYMQYTDPSYKGQDYKGLVVTEKIPAGTQYVEGSATEGGVYKNGTITWTLDMAAGAVKNLTYKVTVTAKQGDEIVSTGGFVGRIPSNTIVNPVGGKKLSETAVAGLKNFGAAGEGKWRETYNISMLAPDTDFAERIYAKAAGLQLDLPTTQEILDNVLERKTMENECVSIRFSGTQSGTAFVLRDTVAPEYQTVKDMIVKDAIGGRKMYFSDNGMTINEFRTNYMEIGDILVWAETDDSGKVTKSTVLVQTDDQQIAIMSTDGLASMVSGGDYLSTITRTLCEDVFFVLRPSLALADVNAAAYDASKEPTYGTEPASSAITETPEPLSEENIAKFKDLQSNDRWTNINTGFAEDVYSMVGLDLKKVTGSNTIVSILKATFTTNASDPTSTSKFQYAPLSPLFMEPKWKAVQAMLVEGYRGGTDMVDNGTLVSDPKVSDLQVGDVLFLLKRGTSIYWTGVYLGDNKLIVSEYQKSVYRKYRLFNLTDSSYKDLLSRCSTDDSAWEAFLLLRPANGFADINTGKTFSS